MTKKEQTITILILGMLSTISPFAIDMYLPGFPEIARDLGADISRVQLSLTSYFIGIAAGQLLYGPLLDRYGRKKPVYVGLTAYILASIGCAFVSDVDSLIGMRFLQAVGGCAGMVAAQTFVRDLFPANRTAQALSWITLVVAVSPLVAPTVGSYVTIYFGWQGVFTTLAVITMTILLAVQFILPQGKAEDTTISLKPVSVLRNFRVVIRQPIFLTYCIAGGLATAAPFAYIAGSSDVLLNVYGATKEEYGWMFAFVGGVVIGSSQLNHYFLRRFTSEQIVSGALIYQMILGSIMVAGGYFGWFDKITVVLVIALFLAGHGLSNPNATALTLQPFKKHTGSAASLAGSFRMAMAGLVSALVSIFHNGTQLPMMLVMAGCIVSGFITLHLGKRLVAVSQSEEREKPVIVL